MDNILIQANNLLVDYLILFHEYKFLVYSWFPIVHIKNPLNFFSQSQREPSIFCKKNAEIDDKSSGLQLIIIKRIVDLRKSVYRITIYKVLKY